MQPQPYAIANTTRGIPLEMYSINYTLQCAFCEALKNNLTQTRDFTFFFLNPNESGEYLYEKAIHTHLL